MPTIGTPQTLSTARNLVLSIRAKIPDPTTDPTVDGRVISLADTIRWINDACRLIATGAPVIVDWYAIPSAAGMGVYNIPSYILSVDQVWYDQYLLTLSAELDTIFRSSKIVAKSWWFGQHTQHSSPRIFLFPACDRTASTTTLTSGVSSSGLSIPVVDGSGMRPIGFISIEGELILYYNVAGVGGSFTNILRGQGGTTPAAHNAGAVVQECNIMFKCTRLPNPITGVDDVIEIPQSLWPLIELYVIANVRETEQESQLAQSLRKEFNDAIKEMGSKASAKGARHGIQVRTAPPGPELYGGRVFIP